VQYPIALFSDRATFRQEPSLLLRK
jgi:hypothetical protein